MSFDLKLENGSFQFSATGALKATFNDEKLKQDIVKILLTPQGSVRSQPWYGSPLSERVIGKNLSPGILDSEMSSSVIFAINNLIKLQGLQAKDGQYLSPTEQISRILDVKISRSIYDPRSYDIAIDVLTKKGTILRETFSLST